MVARSRQSTARFTVRRALAVGARLPAPIREVRGRADSPIIGSSHTTGFKMGPALLVSLAVLLSGSVLAQEQPAAASKPAAAEDRKVDEPNQEAKERVATVAISLFALVAFAGLALLALVIFWGYRTRRIARSPLPPARQLDPFWYLRAEKRPPGEDDEHSP